MMRQTHIRPDCDAGAASEIHLGHPHVRTVCPDADAESAIPVVIARRTDGLELLRGVSGRYFVRWGECGEMLFASDYEIQAWQRFESWPTR
jgi:hypothetical protein